MSGLAPLPPPEQKPPTRKIVGWSLLAAGTGLLVIAVVVPLIEPINTIYDIGTLWFSIGIGFVSLILLIIGLWMVLFGGKSRLIGSWMVLFGGKGKPRLPDKPGEAEQ